MFKYILFFLAFTLPAYGQGQAPEPRKVKGDDPPAVVEVDIDAVPAVEETGWKELKGSTGLPLVLTNKSGKPVYWLLIDASASTTLQPVPPLDDQGRTVTATVGTQVNGRYRILAVGLTGSPAKIAVTFTGGIEPPGPFPPPNPGPGPNPDPNPQPPPPPPPGRTVSKFVIVEDTFNNGKALAWRGDLLGSPAFASLLNNDHLKHRIIDKGTLQGADPEAVAFLAPENLAGKQLPWLWTFDAAGGQIESVQMPTVVEQFMVKVTGSAPHKRAMGNRPPPAKKYAWKQFGKEPNVPLIPRDQWKTIDLTAFLPPVHDQDGIGQCNCSATCSLIEAARRQAGLPYVYLSAGDLYSQINGGRDDGSTLEDGLYAAMKNGVATAKTVPYVWDKRNHANEAAVKAERPLYIVLEAYECPSFDAMVSALQQGFFIVEGLMWYDNFEPDRDGWLPAKGTGRPGGHALLGKGAVQRNGVWGVKTRNSWGPSWGKNGDCIIPESLFGQSIGGYWAVRAVRQTGADFPVTPKVARLNIPSDLAIAPVQAPNLPPVLNP
jgi:hypothetical protein